MEQTLCWPVLVIYSLSIGCKDSFSILYNMNAKLYDLGIIFTVFFLLLQLGITNCNLKEQ